LLGYDLAVAATQGKRGVVLATRLGHLAIVGGCRRSSGWAKPCARTDCWAASPGRRPGVLRAVPAL